MNRKKLFAFLRFILSVFVLYCRCRFKETGANPVRARRREVQKRIFLASLPQTGDKPLKFNFEKVKNMHRVEILADKTSLKPRVPEADIFRLSKTAEQTVLPFFDN